jgi:hypothetical protein
VTKKIKRLKRRPYSRGGRISNVAGTMSVFFVVAALAFLRNRLHPALIVLIMVLFIVIIFLGKKLNR